MSRTITLSEADRQALIDLANRVAKERVDSTDNTAKNFQQQGMDIYVAHPPCPRGIPPREGDVPGWEYCCIFKLVPEYFGADTHILEPLLNADGTQQTKRVHNLDPVWIPPEYLIIRKEKGGRWVPDKPLEQSTTTPIPETSIQQNCRGNCQWIWNDPPGRWTRTFSTCGDPDPATTVYPVTTTECPCNLNREQHVDFVVTTTTLIPTTAYPGPCDCQYPAFCGNAQGDVTSTFCSDNIILDTNQDCPDTTTTPPPTTAPPPTTCDCNTTTLEPLSRCDGGCTWSWAPWQNSWTLLNNTCTDDCPCPPPDQTVGTDCEVIETGCITQPTLPPAQQPAVACVGECTYWWLPESQTWQLVFSGCEQTSSRMFDPGLEPPCLCQEPSDPGDECQPLTRPCVKGTTEAPDPNSVTTTRSPNHCESCYPPTTPPPATTSTTCSPESTPQQLFICQNGVWQFSQGCACYTPLIPGCGGYEDPAGQPCSNDGDWLSCGCEVEQVTTTTCDPLDGCKCLWKWSSDCGGTWALAKDPCVSPAFCPTPIGMGVTNQQQETACITTAAPATTTLAPQAGCDPRWHDCVWQWSDNCVKWIKTVNNCGSGCACAEPAKPVGNTNETTRMPCTTEAPTTTSTTTLVPTTTTTQCPTTPPPTSPPPTPGTTTTTCAPNPATLFTRLGAKLTRRDGERLEIRATTTPGP